ncbi:MAG: hypothetical protein K9I84_06385 [Leadbetterella sp.]|nr:hypothetical protein [Leadbetterella sp.]
MKKNFIFFIVILFLSTLIFSCKKKKADPSAQNTKCPLVSMDGPSGNIRNYEWVGSKLVRVFSRDSIPTVVVFRYNNKNLAESMEITTENSAEKYIVKFVYGTDNIITKSNVSINGIQFMTNEFVYNENNKLSSIKTTVELFGRKVSGKTRLEYTSENVSKVYSSINDELEILAFTGEKYDTKKQFYPEVYKTAALGFVGIANNFFSYFGENNMISGKVYNDKGKVDQETQIDYLYNNSGLPIQSETVSVRNGKKSVEVCSYSFNCK